MSRSSSFGQDFFFERLQDVESVCFQRRAHRQSHLYGELSLVHSPGEARCRDYGFRARPVTPMQPQGANKTTVNGRRKAWPQRPADRVVHWSFSTASQPTISMR